ncbi:MULTISPECIES: LysE family translocator [Photorhabdus]|uniref:Threonine/homoserine/homoserine lactone efflux protein n=2 Tax=Photorhabdus asymbiotica TaxID=291112 RepID=A0ABX9SPJ3_9GAMM|nr:LysE family translocator [Photorhabdus asymbiotica]RKS59930.1 threonine/homoserine/homoserine lactone efflux protein [Photorhabdus asymbiotica]CAQ86083.1 putative membrane protein similar to predicted rhtb family transporters [Photorhabdus asymbiotica]
MFTDFTTLQGLLGLLLTSSILIAIPGPSIMFIVGQALSVGRANALRGVIGNAIGTYCVAVVLALGIGSLLTQSSTALMVIRLLGAIALLVIGFQYIFFSKPLQAGENISSKKNKQTLALGIIVGATNPKALIMFGTIVPSFLTEGIDSPILSLLSFSLIPIGLGLVIDTAWVAAAHAVSLRASFTEKRMKLVNILGGGMIIIMAIFLAMGALL